MNKELEKEIEIFLKNKGFKFAKNYEGPKVPFSHELNMESKYTVYYLLDHKIIITFQFEEYIARPFIESKGWKFITLKEARRVLIA